MSSVEWSELAPQLSGRMNNGHKWYRTAAWQRLRRRIFVRDRYICAICGSLCTGQGRSKRAPIADHIIPHKGNRALFWNEENIQTLCYSCHSRHKQRQEAGGAIIGCDANGVPLDPETRAKWIKT